MSTHTTPPKPRQRDLPGMENPNRKLTRAEAKKAFAVLRENITRQIKAHETQAH